jgi:hypothetical protein
MSLGQCGFLIAAMLGWAPAYDVVRAVISTLGFSLFMLLSVAMFAGGLFIACIDSERRGYWREQDYYDQHVKPLLEKR